MSLSIYRRTRSARLTVTTPEGQRVTVENLRGDNGCAMSFSATRKMDEYPGEFEVRAYNLPADVLGVIEYAQTRRVNDLDKLLSGLTLKTGIVDPLGDDALAAGFCQVELEAGYDGVMSRVFKAIGSRIVSARIDDDMTEEIVIEAVEDLDAVLLGVPQASFPPGASTFEVVDYLRKIAGLGPGNLTPANFAALLGESKLDSGYHCSGGQALSHLRNVLQYLPLRWFVDDREIWICGRDDQPNPGGVPAYVVDQIIDPEILTARPQRVDGGRVRVECFLCPRAVVGRLVRLTPGGLGLVSQGLSASAKQQANALVPPGLYRLEEVEHRGDTSGADWTTNMLLRPGVALGE